MLSVICSSLEHLLLLLVLGILHIVLYNIVSKIGLLLLPLMLVRLSILLAHVYWVLGHVPWSLDYVQILLLFILQLLLLSRL